MHTYYYTNNTKINLLTHLHSNQSITITQCLLTKINLLTHLGSYHSITITQCLLTSTQYLKGAMSAGEHAL